MKWGWLIVAFAALGGSAAGPAWSRPPVAPTGPDAEKVVANAMARANARAKAGDDPRLIEAELMWTLGKANLSPENENPDPAPWDTYGRAKAREVYSPAPASPREQQPPLPGRRAEVALNPAVESDTTDTYPLEINALTDTWGQGGYSLPPANPAEGRHGTAEPGDRRTGTRVRIQVPTQGGDL